MWNAYLGVDRSVSLTPSAAADAVVAADLTRKFGAAAVLAGLTLRVRRGSIFGLIGRNGAGKTTAISCVCGLLEPTSGEIRVFGEPIGCQAARVKRRIGVMPEGLALFDQLLASEFLEFNALMYGLDRETARCRTLELLEFLGLTSALSRPLCEFSAGMRQKVAFAAAAIHRPDLLLLDEPFASMDASAVAMLKEWLRRYVGRGGTVLMTSHALDTVERFCDDVALIEQGRIMWQGDVAVLSGGGVLRAQGHTFRTLESLFVHFVGQPSNGPEWL